MAGHDTQSAASPAQAPMVGDHLAMDLLNTEARSDGQAVDYWNSGDDVLHWLQRHGAVPPSWSGTVDRAGLLAHGRTLRTLARQLITRRKQGEAVDLGALNDYLHIHRSAPHLERDQDGNWALTRIAQGDATASLLGPVAEAVARMLVEGDFALVKQCEHPDCILWFYDRTKAHKRRWCSMASCGNRHKAAQFRKRSGGQAP